LTQSHGNAMNFWKLTSAGNDFICIDNLDGSYDRYIETPGSRRSLAEALCDRNTGVGADGIAILLESSSKENRFSSLSIEPDGSECELCGNCMASLSRYLFLSGISRSRDILIETPAGTVTARYSGDEYVSLEMPPPEKHQADILLLTDNGEIECDCIVVGIPHAAIFVDNLDGMDIEKPGRFIRHHERFKPRGINVNFVKVSREGKIAVRTYEFGVEGETLACGTGSCASAVMSALRYKWNGDITSGETPVLVGTRSGRTVRVFMELDDETGECGKIRLETPVLKIMQGKINNRWIADRIR